MRMFFNKITIIGPGLIGGSIGLACKEKGLAETVVGVGRSLPHLEKAVNLGAVDSFELGLASGVAEADLVILAIPVGAMPGILSNIAEHLKPGSVVTDAGSTKARITEAAERLMPPGVCFVGGHPIAGRENSGVEAASASLFVGAKSILTPTSNTNPRALSLVRELWEQLGAKVVLMDVDQHDRILAIISHLPHMVAYCLVNTLADLDEREEELIALAAGGFKDFTRIAASDPSMWRDICLDNSRYIVDAIEHFQLTLEKLKHDIKSKNARDLSAQFERANLVKKKL
jgi:prephenate dehydrogenase